MGNPVLDTLKIKKFLELKEGPKKIEARHTKIVIWFNVQVNQTKCEYDMTLEFNSH